MAGTGRPSLGDIDQTMFQDMSRSVSQICNHMTLANVNVPRFNSFNDVFDFLAEFEAVTSTNSDDQKVILLTKAFPPGRHRSWFETELLPLIDGQKPWKDVKDKIIQRFSETEDKDRHFLRLRELKYNPNGDQRLLDFVEDLLYSYKKAFPHETSIESKLRYIKAAVPSELKPSLSVIPEYRDAKSEEDLKKGVKQYDVTRGGVSNQKANNQIGISELATVLKDMMNGIKSEGEATRKTIVAALNVERPNYRREDQYQRDTRSPGRQGYHSPNHSSRNFSPNYRHNRQVSPRRYYDNQNNTKTESKSVNQEKDKDHSLSPRPNEDAFSSEHYFSRFGKPPTPCGDCGYWHWNRHCIKHLN